ncbi:unnamed protein product [Caenorhabditis brenneri]
MSLSRPVKFPLLKLPWLCIRCVIRNSDEFILICFATISNRTRRIVKASKPLKEIDVHLSWDRSIRMGETMGYSTDCKVWCFKNGNCPYVGKFVLQMNSQPFHTRQYIDRWGCHFLESYTAGDTSNALRMGIDFMTEVFGCTIRQILVDENMLPKLVGLGISSVEELFISNTMSDPGPVNITDLKYLLETIKVTDSYVFYAPIPANFSCDPKIFNCRRINFACEHSADWVTLEFLCQLDVSYLTVRYVRLSKEDIVSYITHWFNSENRNLEYVQLELYNPVSLENFNIEHLNPMPYDEKRRNRCPLDEGWIEDMSSGMDILRQDGLLATFYVDFTSVIFYVWHKRFPDAVQQ